MRADKELIGRLRSVDVFKDLTDAEIAEIAQRASFVDHEAGREVVREGGRGVGFHLVLEGEATVEQGGQSRAKLVAGSYFGEISLIDGKPRTATIRAETPMRTLSLVAWDFKPLLASHPNLALNLLQGLCARVRRLEDERSAPATA